MWDGPYANFLATTMAANPNCVMMTDGAGAAVWRAQVPYGNIDARFDDMLDVESLPASGTPGLLYYVIPTGQYWRWIASSWVNQPGDPQAAIDASVGAHAANAHPYVDAPNSWAASQTFQSGIVVSGATIAASGVDQTIGTLTAGGAVRTNVLQSAGGAGGFVLGATTTAAAPLTLGAHMLTAGGGVVMSGATLTGASLVTTGLLRAVGAGSGLSLGAGALTLELPATTQSLTVNGSVSGATVVQAGSGTFGAVAVSGALSAGSMSAASVVGTSVSGPVGAFTTVDATTVNTAFLNCGFGNIDNIGYGGVSKIRTTKAGFINYHGQVLSGTTMRIRFLDGEATDPEGANGFTGGYLDLSGGLINCQAGLNLATQSVTNATSVQATSGRMDFIDTKAGVPRLSLGARIDCQAPLSLQGQALVAVNEVHDAIGLAMVFGAGGSVTMARALNLNGQSLSNVSAVGAVGGLQGLQLGATMTVYQPTNFNGQTVSNIALLSAAQTNTNAVHNSAGALRASFGGDVDLWRPLWMNGHHITVGDIRNAGGDPAITLPAGPTMTFARNVEMSGLVITGLSSINGTSTDRYAVENYQQAVSTGVGFVVYTFFPTAGFGYVTSTVTVDDVPVLPNIHTAASIEVHGSFVEGVVVRVRTTMRRL